MGAILGTLNLGAAPLASVTAETVAIVFDAPHLVDFVTVSDTFIVTVDAPDMPVVPAAGFVLVER